MWVAKLLSTAVTTASKMELQVGVMALLISLVEFGPGLTSYKEVLTDQLNSTGDVSST